MKKLPLVLVLLGLPLAWATPLSVTYAGPPASHLGDLTPFETIARDTAVLIGNGDIAAARKRITDFEKAWDEAQPTLRPQNIPEWSVIDDAADAAIAALRAPAPDAVLAGQAVSSLEETLKHPQPR